MPGRPRASQSRPVPVASPSAWALSQGQEDQEQSDNKAEQSDAEPRAAARHEAPLDQTGALTYPGSTNQDSESADDHDDGARDLRCHVARDPIG
jgi:hypothetical protein